MMPSTGTFPHSLRQVRRIDLARLLKREYAAPATPVVLEIETGCYLSIEGRGEPGGQAFKNSVDALYAVAFTIRMAKKCERAEYSVGKLEALWEGPDRALPFIDQDKSGWRWQLLIRTPSLIRRSDLASAVAVLEHRRKFDNVESVTLERLNEGLCVQCLHVGPYSEERFTIERMAALCADRNLRMAGPHHEIYLSDPRRTRPQRLRTILRWPVAPGIALAAAD